MAVTPSIWRICLGRPRRCLGRSLSFPSASSDFSPRPHPRYHPSSRFSPHPNKTDQISTFGSLRKHNPPLTPPIPPFSITPPRSTSINGDAIAGSDRHLHGHHQCVRRRRRRKTRALFFPPWVTNHKSIHSKSDPPLTDDFSEYESCCSGSSSTSSASMEIRSTSNQEPSSKEKVLSELKRSTRHDLMMVFTCKVCETRSVKTTCRQSYEKGIVVARCDGCNNLHLIADRLGWFGEPGSVEDLLAARGEEVKRGTTNTLNFTLEDLVGTKP